MNQPIGPVIFRDQVLFESLSGSGNRMVIASSTGLLSTQAIPGGGAGTVTSITASSPLTGGTITTTGTIGITQSSSVADGYLSSTDWNTFNGKEPAITTGTSSQYYRGDKTFQTLNTAAVTESTNLYYTDTRARLALSAGTGITYNNTTGVITNASPDQTVGLTGAGTTSISGTYPNFTITSNDQFVGTVTSVGLSTSTSGVTIASTPVTTSGTITVDIATASGSQNGLLSSTDFGTFNGKQPQLNGTGFVKASGTTISYDNTSYLPLTGGNLSGNLGVGYGTSAEQYLTIGEARTGNNFAYIDLIGDTTYTDYGSRFIRYDTGANALTKLEHRGTGNFVIQAVDSADIVFQTQSADKMILKSGGNLLVGTGSDSGDKLQVNGAIKTAAPTGYSAQPWKLGDYTAGGITTDGYILVEINGNLYTIPALAGLP